MSTLNNTVSSLLDVLKLHDSKGQRRIIIDRLAKSTSIIKDIPFKEGNTLTGHTFLSRSKLPSVSWRVLNEGVAASKEENGLVTETCGKLSGLSRVDEAVAKFNGDMGAFRASRDAAFVTAMEEEVESSFIYASSKVYPEKILGVIPRLDSTTGLYGTQVLLSELTAGGSDSSSILLIVWGEETVHGIYPKGSAGGLEMIDRGPIMQEDSSGSGKYNNYLITEFNWQLGLCVVDPRYFARLCNLDASAGSDTGQQLIRDMIRLKNKVQDLKKGTPVYYVNRSTYTRLELQAFDTVRGGGGMTYENVDGRPLLKFQGIPVRMTECLLATESGVS